MKNLNISYLLDVYGPVLTDKQRDVVELYYCEDLSLAEIAEICGITRQGVRDSIKRGEAVILELEEKLGIVKRFQDILVSVDVIRENTKEINYCQYIFLMELPGRMVIKFSILLPYN